jgi:hypothetical protein
MVMKILLIITALRELGRLWGGIKAAAFPAK